MNHSSLPHPARIYAGLPRTATTQSVDFILEGKSYRAWPQSGQGQVAPGARVPMPRLYDAEQFVQKLQHINLEQIVPLCTLAGLFQSNIEDLTQALHKGQLIIGLAITDAKKILARYI